MKLRYIGTRPFKLQIGDEICHLQEGDIVDVKPWKIRSSRLDVLFEVAETDPEALTKADKKFLKGKKGFADPELYAEKMELTLEEALKEIEKEKKKT